MYAFNKHMSFQALAGIMLLNDRCLSTLFDRRDDVPHIVEEKTAFMVGK